MQRSNSDEVVAVCPDRILASHWAMSSQLVFQDLAYIRLYQLEKRFGQIEEPLESFEIDEKDTPENPHTEPEPLSFRQMMNNPDTLIPLPGSGKGDISKKKKGKKGKSPAIPNVLDSIAQFDNHCKYFTKMVK